MIMIGKNGKIINKGLTLLKNTYKNNKTILYNVLALPPKQILKDFVNPFLKYEIIFNTSRVLSQIYNRLSVYQAAFLISVL